MQVTQQVHSDVKRIITYTFIHSYMHYFRNVAGTVIIESVDSMCRDSENTLFVLLQIVVRWVSFKNT